MLVRDLMTPSVVTASPNDTVASATQRMHERGVTAIVVTDGERVAGIFTERDLVPIVGLGLDPTTVPVRDHMTTEVEVVAPGLDIEQASRLMRERNFEHLPVVSGSMCIGMLTLRDIVAWRADAEQTEAQTDLHAVVDGQEFPTRH